MISEEESMRYSFDNKYPKSIHVNKYRKRENVYYIYLRFDEFPSIDSIIKFGIEILEKELLEKFHKKLLLLEDEDDYLRIDTFIHFSISKEMGYLIYDFRGYCIREKFQNEFFLKMTSYDNEGNIVYEDSKTLNI